MKKPPKCECHGEPCYWHKKKDMRAGGLWRCAVRKREVQRNYERTPKAEARNDRHRNKANQQKRDRYDADALYRISKNLHDHARRRRQTIQRKKEAA